MRTDLVPYLFSFVWPASFLVLALSFLPMSRRHKVSPPFRMALMVMVAMGVSTMWIGSDPYPLGRWLTGVCANFSLPLLVLIADLVGRRVLQVDFLGEKGRRDATRFGMIAGISLFPMALGIGNTDPYEFGWSFSWLFAAIGILTALLVLRGNRFGFALLAAIAAFQLHLLESDNYWDYLVDPVYFLVSLVAVIRHFAGSRASARSPGTPHHTPASP